LFLIRGYAIWIAPQCRVKRLAKAFGGGSGLASVFSATAGAANRKQIERYGAGIAQAERPVAFASVKEREEVCASRSIFMALFSFLARLFEWRNRRRSWKCLKPGSEKALLPANLFAYKNSCL